MRTTYPTTQAAETQKSPSPQSPAPESEPVELSMKQNPSDKLLVGLDLGTNSTCVKAASPGGSDLLVDQIIPTIVGYAKEGIVPNLLPGNAKVLYGQSAMKNRLYLRMVPPLRDGIIEDMAAAQDFARHLGQLINAPAGTEVRAVVGVPASANRSAHEAIAATFSGVFQKMILIPEPFLAALGYREESRLGDPTYQDPVRNSLFVDIGAGTTDVCLVQGYFPTAEDQVSASFAGDDVDNLLHDAIRKQYPDVNLSLVRIREIKEEHSRVGTVDATVFVNVVVAGKMRKLELGAAIESACAQLLQNVFDLVKTAIARVSSESAAELLQNIILTGGGSRINSMDTELQRLLAEEGFEKPRVLTVGENYKDYVSKGALVAARQAKQNQWQPLGV